MSVGHPLVDIVFCVSGDPTTLAELETHLTGLAEGAFTVRGVTTAAELTQAATDVTKTGALIPLVFVDEWLGDATGVDTLIALKEHPGLRTARKVLLAEHLSRNDLDRAQAHRVLDATLVFRGARLSCSRSYRGW